MCSLYLFQINRGKWILMEDLSSAFKNMGLISAMLRSLNNWNNTKLRTIIVCSFAPPTFRPDVNNITTNAVFRIETTIHFYEDRKTWNITGHCVRKAQLGITIILWQNSNLWQMSNFTPACHFKRYSHLNCTNAQYLHSLQYCICKNYNIISLQHCLNQWCEFWTRDYLTNSRQWGVSGETNK